MQQSHPEADFREEAAPIGESGLEGEGLYGGIGRQPAVDADQDGSSHGAERDGRALNNHPGHDRAHGREPQSDQQGHSDGCRCPEAGRAFDEAAEQPGDDHYLNPSIGGHVGEAASDGLNGPAPPQRVEQQDGSEDDVEQGGGNHQAVDGGRGQLPRRYLPHQQPQCGGNQVGDGHGPPGRPPQQHQQQRYRNDGEGGQQRECEGLQGGTCLVS